MFLSAHVMSVPKKAPRFTPSETPLNHLLFEALRGLRKKLAEEHNVPPYVIFGDRSLHEMCQHLPKNKDDLSQIFGVGSTKLTQFGDAFLEVIGEYIS